MIKVFMGGTCNGSKWRDELTNSNIEGVSFFNPVVDNWNSEAQEREVLERTISDYCLYVITPKLLGVYAIAEAIDDSHRRPDKTIFVLLNEDEGMTFSKAQKASLERVAYMVHVNGGKSFHNLATLQDFFKHKMSNGH
jgi:hypothetical protein